MKATLPKLQLPPPSRRQFLTGAGSGLAWLSWPRRARCEITGSAIPKLAAYDELMTSFMREHQPPGAALAVTYHGRLVYARGFGHAEVEKQEPVQPTSLFRIASLSKPITSAAVFHMIEKHKVGLDDRIFPILKLEPHLAGGARLDPRWHEIRVRQCLQHTGGWDRGKSLDPMSAAGAEETAKALNVALPINARQIIRFTMGRPLDFAPGTACVYSNFGYCVLGRVIEAVSGKRYHEFVTEQILGPLGISRMRLGKNLLRDRAPGEVRYYDAKKRTGRAISGPNIGKDAPLPYGVECIETMDANGGWIASAVDLMRFAVALDNPKKCPILREQSITAMLAAPPGSVGHEPNGRAKERYYGCGWDCRPAARRPGKYTKWHGGGLAGSSTFMLCRDDGINWAVLFNSDANKNGKAFADLIDEPLHRVADGIKSWPEINLFPKF
jgi:N-acyl-D-amino-acid deacylase